MSWMWSFPDSMKADMDKGCCRCSACFDHCTTAKVAKAQILIHHLGREASFLWIMEKRAIFKHLHWFLLSNKTSQDGNEMEIKREDARMHERTKKTRARLSERWRVVEAGKIRKKSATGKNINPSNWRFNQHKSATATYYNPLIKSDIQAWTEKHTHTHIKVVSWNEVSD